METGAWILQHEVTVRLTGFFGVLGLMAVWETLAPRRTPTLSKTSRWPNNLGVVALNTVLLRLLLPAGAVGMALLAEQQRWGVLPYLQVPTGLAIFVSVVVFDLAIYLQHVMFHAVPALWRLHRMHHMDLDFDVTTGARFHPIEILLSMLIKFAVVAVLGAPPLGVLIFEVLLNATSLFNHGNVRLARALDRWLRWLVVTPEMHRVHHSIEEHETNSNFGFNLPWWDRLFGTYRDQPQAGHEHMAIGITTFRDPKRCATLFGMLLSPFIGKVTDYAINRRRFERG